MIKFCPEDCKRVFLVNLVSILFDAFDFPKSPDVQDALLFSGTTLKHNGNVEGKITREYHKCTENNSLR